MRAKHAFAKTSFLIIIALMVSFSFVKEAGLNISLSEDNSVPVKILQDPSQKGNNESLVTVKFFDSNNKLLYKEVVDLNNKHRERNKKLNYYLANSSLIKKVNNELHFRIK